MRPQALLRTGWLLLAMGAGPWPTALAFVDPPPTGSPVDVQVPAEAVEGDPVATLERGSDFERQRNWSAAIQVYRDAKDKWPSRAEFKQRLRLAEMHHRLVRRYQDAQLPRRPAPAPPREGVRPASTS